MSRTRVHHKNLNYEIIKDPSSNLTDDERAVVLSQAVPVARSGFGNPSITTEDIALHLFGSGTTILVRDRSESVVGFSSADILKPLGENVIYLQGSVFAPQVMGQGAYNVVNALRILDGLETLDQDSAYVATRTQSPIVVRNAIRKYGLSPRPDAKTPAEIPDLARGLAQIIYDEHSDFKHPDGVKFDPHTLVQEMAYGVLVDGKPKGFCMYGEHIPWARDDHWINGYLKETLDFENGDALIPIGKVNATIPQAYLAIDDIDTQIPVLR